MTENRAPLTGIFRRIPKTIAYLFKGKSPSEEGCHEQRTEGEWEEEFRNDTVMNCAEIFATQLTNYALYGGTVSADDEEIDSVLQRFVRKARKACIWSLAVGRVYLVPYITDGDIYTDIIPQSRTIITRRRGDDILGFACLADLRTVGRERFARWTLYDYDPATKTFSVENKATKLSSDAEVSLAVVREWEGILPYIAFEGVEKPLFAFVDSPRDNRDTDMMQGAAITLGAEKAIEELHKNIRDFFEEFDKKRAKLGVDKAMIEKGTILDRYTLGFNGGVNGTGLFEIFDPAMREQAYISREDAVSKRIEKMVGTSSGILTNAETAMATATQVRRSMFSTVAMVDAIRKSLDDAVDSLCYTYEIYLALVGKRVRSGYTVTSTWSQSYIEDDMERFNKVQQGHTAGVISDLELRREIYPNESPEEAQKALEEIEANKPDPFEFIGGSDGGDAGAEVTEEPIEEPTVEVE